MSHCKGFWTAKIGRDEEGGRKVTLARDDAAREAYCSRTFGKLTAKDRIGWTTGEILSAYTSRERVEDLSETTKDPSAPRCACSGTGPTTRSS